MSNRFSAIPFFIVISILVRGSWVSQIFGLNKSDLAMHISNLSSGDLLSTFRARDAELSAGCLANPTMLRLFHSAQGNASWPTALGSSVVLSDCLFLCLRLVMAAAFVATLTVDVAYSFDQGLMFIYLTRWTFTVETLYMVTAVAVTLKARRAKGFPSSGESEGRLPLLAWVMWLLWSIAMPMSLVVCAAFWTLLDPFWSLNPYLKLSETIIFEHLINALLLLVELCVSRNPFDFRISLILCSVYGALYIVWSLVHFWARIGIPESLSGSCHYASLRDCPIYGVLDWHNPGPTSVVVIAVTVLAVICVTFVWFCTRLRNQFSHSW
eukprot:TRINITY_DN113166_c0_g1_i1.p1 TRINITY_DN113166_c0_g1~~TRINITY_DN113166_c0_g1_i1.p1  ORF type:complete len:325 (-),score=27.39 TRINITY_DN113166_c0_g1_i1:8-982(-)